MEANINISHIEKVSYERELEDNPISKNYDIFKAYEIQCKEEDELEKRALGIKMEPKYFIDNYNKKYELNDLGRICKGTFDALKYFETYPNDAARGPWRETAYEKAENNPQFKEFIDEQKGKRAYLVKSVIIDNNKKTFHYPDVIYKKTNNESFEKFAEACRKVWNKEHKYQSKVESYEDAFKKALLILGTNSDPFHGRRVEVLHDSDKKIFFVRKTQSFNISETIDDGVQSVVLHENGEVLAIN